MVVYYPTHVFAGVDLWDGLAHRDPDHHLFLVGVGSLKEEALVVAQVTVGY